MMNDKTISDINVVQNPLPPSLFGTYAEKLFSKKVIVFLASFGVLQLGYTFLTSQAFNKAFIYFSVTFYIIFAAYVFLFFVFHTIRGAIGMKVATPIITFENDELNSAVKKITQNAKFLSGGFLEVQHNAINIESKPVRGKSVRYAVNNHIPSCIRSDELTSEVANILYNNWTPKYLLGDYTKLINQRADAIDPVCSYELMERLRILSTRVY